MRRLLPVTFLPVLLAFWTLVSTWITLWGLGTLDAVGWPSWQWWAFALATMPDADTQSRVDWWVEVGAVAGGVVTAVLAFRLLTTPRPLFGQPDRPLHGESKFATAADGRRSGLIYSRTPRPDCLL